jgi:hypothetical protein
VELDAEGTGEYFMRTIVLNGHYRIGHKTLQMLKRYTHLMAEDLAKMLG